MRWLDANLFVRVLTQDNPDMLRRALDLFERISAGQEEVYVLEATVAEVVYVLSSRSLYSLPRDVIRDSLTPLLVLRSLRVEHKERCLRALDIFVENRSLGFGDSLLAAAALDDDGRVYSFDRGFDRLAGISRLEP